MILSKRFGFLFIKGRKVAGTSIEMALSRICGPDDIVTPLMPPEDRIRIEAGHPPRNFAAPDVEKAYIDAVASASPEQLGDVKFFKQGFDFYNHITMKEVQRRYAGSIRDFTLMCAERSPYDKIISYAKWRDAIPVYRAGQSATFGEEWLRDNLHSTVADRSALKVRNIDMYRGRRGNRLPKVVLHYETLAEDFAAAMARFGVSNPPTLPHLKNTGRAAQPEHLFRDEHIEWVNESFAEEFDAFRYATIAPNESRLVN